MVSVLYHKIVFGSLLCIMITIYVLIEYISDYPIYNFTTNVTVFEKRPGYNIAVTDLYHYIILGTYYILLSVL